LDKEFYKMKQLNMHTLSHAFSKTYCLFSVCTPLRFSNKDATQLKSHTEHLALKRRQVFESAGDSVCAFSCFIF